MRPSDDLITRCKEIVQWQKTGLYTGTALQALADSMEERGMANSISGLITAELYTLREAITAIAHIDT